jgi:hypothetical protein
LTSRSRHESTSAQRNRTPHCRSGLPAGLRRIPHPGSGYARNLLAKILERSDLFRKPSARHRNDVHGTCGHPGIARPERRRDMGCAGGGCQYPRVSLSGDPLSSAALLMTDARASAAVELLSHAARQLARPVGLGQPAGAEFLRSTSAILRRVAGNDDDFLLREALEDFVEGR